jgi:hypothetical protein
MVPIVRVRPADMIKRPGYLPADVLRIITKFDGTRDLSVVLKMPGKISLSLLETMDRLVKGSSVCLVDNYDSVSVCFRD